MDFSIGNLVSAVEGGIAKVANAVVNTLNSVISGITGMVKSVFGAVESAVDGALAMIGVVDSDGDGDVDLDDAEELLEEKYKAFVGAVMGMFGSKGHNLESYYDGDNIVISGDYTSENRKYIKRSFIETAIKRINDLKN